jgi:transcriptional regulator with XRE-family HTH domain
MSITGKGMGNFAVWLKDLRDRAGMLQMELAERLGVSKQYMSDVEHGHRLPPDDKYLLRISIALLVTPDVVFCRAGRLPPDLREVDVDDATLARAIAAFRSELRGDR